MAEVAETSTGFALEAEQKAKPPKKSAKAARPAESPHFDRWWAEYPKHQDRLGALKAWHRHDCDAMVDRIVADTRRLKATAKWKAGYIPMPATFINGARWEDESDPVPRQPLPNAYGAGTALRQEPKPGIEDHTLAGLNLLLLKVMMSYMGQVPEDCMAQLLRKRDQIREWIGDRIFNQQQSQKLAAIIKKRFAEIILEYERDVGHRSAGRDARREVPSSRALAAQGARIVGDGF